MNTYQTYLTLDHSHKIVLSDLPFEEGTKLSINISTVADEIPTSSDFQALLDNTQGIWTKGDGLEYQQQVRDEWS